MAIGRLDHYTIRTGDLAATRRFYTDVMGFSIGPRPAFPFPGAWLYQDGAPLVHVIEDAGAGAGAAMTGRIDHIAFTATDLAGVRARLAALGIRFDQRTVPDQAVHQVFLTDPNGIRLELNFPAAEATG